MKLSLRHPSPFAEEENRPRPRIFRPDRPIPDLHEHYQIDTYAIIAAALHPIAKRRIRLAGG